MLDGEMCDHGSRVFDKGDPRDHDLREEILQRDLELSGLREELRFLRKGLQAIELDNPVPFSKQTRLNDGRFGRRITGFKYGIPESEHEDFLRAHQTASLSK